MQCSHEKACFYHGKQTEEPAYWRYTVLSARNIYNILMNSTILTLRAITAVYFQRLLTIFGLLIGGGLFLSYVLLVFLVAQVSAWWWLLFAILFPLTVLAIVVFLALFFLSNKLLPRKVTNEERASLRKVADLAINLAETTRTPVPLLFMMVAKDVVRGRESSMLRGAIDDSTSLRQEFMKTKQMFSQ